MFISDLLKDKNEFEKFLLNIIVKRGRKYKKIDELIKFSNNVITIYSYIVNVSKKPFPEKEWIIAQYSAYSFNYAKNIIKGRWEKGEEVISKDAFYSFKYASEILKDRFIKGEEVISKNAFYSFCYASEIIKGRWEKGENALVKDSSNLKKYISFLKSIGKLDEFLKDYPEVKI
jgi:uncharacterized membrane protein